MTARWLSTSSRSRAKDSESNGVHDEPLGTVDNIPINLLRPYDRNARTHDKRQIAKIATSLETFGWMNPILAEANGTIITGHGRWTAARELKMKPVPVINAVQPARRRPVVAR